MGSTPVSVIRSVALGSAVVIATRVPGSYGPLVRLKMGAAVVIVKFNDYQCPGCGQTYRDYKPVLAKYAKLVSTASEGAVTDKYL